MKKLWLWTIFFLLTITSILYLDRSEKAFASYLEEKSALLSGAVKNTNQLLAEVGLGPGWMVLILFLAFLFSVIMGGKIKLSGSSALLVFVFLLGVGLTLALVAWIYSLPQDKTVMAGVVIDRGPRDSFLEKVIHMGILVGIGHFYSLLVIALALNRKSKSQKVKKGK